MAFASIEGRRIEYRMIPGDALAQPTLVFLHEGLGCVGLWRDFPDKIAARLGARALIYSRFGYGQSDGLLAKRTPRFMHEEGLKVLPDLLDQLGIDKPLLSVIRTARPSPSSMPRPASGRSAGWR